MLQYNRDYNEKYPLAVSWADGLNPYVTIGQKPSDPQAYFLERLQCPTSGSTYVYNRNTAGIAYMRALAAATPKFTKSAPDRTNLTSVMPVNCGQAHPFTMRICGAATMYFSEI